MTLATSFSFVEYGSTFPVERVFFKNSDSMGRGKARTIIRGLEYYSGLKKVISLAASGAFDVVHIQWLLMYKLDIWFLSKLKQLGIKVVYTAHNAIPHVDGESAVAELKKIYSLVDVIVVHGESIKDELCAYFPDVNPDSILIQKHGTYSYQDASFDSRTVDAEVSRKVDSYERRYIIFGNQFYNKGSDRVLRMWSGGNLDLSNSLLIYTGRLTEKYEGYEEALENAKQLPNFLHIDGYLESNLLNYLIHKADAVLLPYRHASMSGVVFQAAEFSKPVLLTKVGALADYVVDGYDSILVENEDEEIERGIALLESMTADDLKLMGERLADNITTNYSWKAIAEKLNESVYAQEK